MNENLHKLKKVLTLSLTPKGFNSIRFRSRLLLLLGIFTLALGGAFAQSDDFEAATLDTTKWKVRNNSHQGFIITGPSPSGSKHLRVNSTNNTVHSNHMYQQFAAINPTYLSWYVKMDTISGPGGYVVIGDSGLATNSSNCIIFAYINTASVVPNFQVANVSSNYTQPYTPGTWVKVECKNINYTTRKFDLWVNDTLRSSAFNFRSSTLTHVSYVRVYNFSANNLVSYIDNLIILGPPTLSTAAPSAVSGNSATLGGAVLDSGQTATTERGIVYGTAPNPTTANTKVQIGNGLGAFSQNITGLTSNTKYYVRAYAINGVGTGYGRLDSFTTLSGPPVPNISTSGSLNSFTTCAGNPSAQQTFTVSGSNLTANITVTPPSGFEVSTTSGSGFGSSVTLTQSGGTVSATTVYVRLASTATGTPSGNITCVSTGANTQNVSANGTVNALPTITLGIVSSVLTTATTFSLPYSATTGSPNQYSITTGSPTAMPSFAAVNNATLGSSPITVTIPTSAANTYHFNLTVSNSTTGCVSNNNPFTLTVGNPEPTLNFGGTLSTFNTCAGTPSTEQFFSVSGSYLTNNVTVTAPDGFEISTLPNAGYSKTVNAVKDQNGNILLALYARMSATASGSITDSLMVSSSGATNKYLKVIGNANPLPSLTLGSIAPILITATSFNLTYTATIGNPNEYSINAGSPNAMPGFAAVTNAALGSSPIVVKIPASAAGNYDFILMLKNTSTGCPSNSIPFVLNVVNPVPTVTISGSFDPIAACSGTASGAQQFKVSGAYLTSNVTVTAPTGFEIATTLTGTFGATVILSPVSGTIADTSLYARMSSSATGTPSGNITCSSAGATDKTLAINGTIIPNPAKPVISIQTANPVCQGAEYLNFGASTEAPAGVSYQWSTTNALLYAQGSTKQHALVSFPNAGDATITLTATQNGCSSEENITYSVKADEAHTATIRYFNKNFVCEVNEVNKYQWGFDDLPSLKGNVLSGEITQNYYNANPDLATKSYWALTTKGNCYQKTYYNKPASVDNITNNDNNLMVYPNPFSSEITLRSQKNLAGASIALMDMNGKVLYNFNATTPEPKLNLNELTSGIYMIQVSTENGQVSNAKIVKY